MIAFIVSYVFDVFFYIFDIDSLAVFLNHMYLIVSDSGWRKTNLLPLPVIEYFMDKPS